MPTPRIAWLVAALALCGLAAGAKDKPAKSALAETVHVRTVTLPVAVTDGSGAPLEGLTADDFVLKVDGKKTRITNFARVSGSPGAGVAAATAPSGSAGAGEGVPVVTPGTLRVALLVDNRNLSPIRRNAAVERLRRLLEEGEIPDEVPVMIVSSDTSVRVVEPFTTDRGKLDRALAGMETSNASGPQRFEDRERESAQLQDHIRAAIDCMRSPACSNEQQMIHSAVTDIRSYAQGAAQQARPTVEALRMLCNSLSVHSGRKVVLYVGDGFAMTPGEDLVLEMQQSLRSALRGELAASADASQSTTGGPLGGTSGDSGGSRRSRNEQMEQMVNRAFQDVQTYSVSDALDEVMAAATASDVRVYTLQAFGLSSGVVGADVPSSDTAMTLNETMSSGRTRELNLRAPLERMAEQTGGLSLRGTATVSDLTRSVVDDAYTGYSLGFEAPDPPDGKPHAVELSLKGAKGKLRYPRAFLSKDDATRRREQTLAALLVGGDNPYEIGLETGGLEKDALGKALLPVTVFVPVRHMALSSSGGNRVTDLTLEVIVQGPDGDVVVAQEHPIPVRIPADKLEQAMAAVFPVRMKLGVVPGRNRIAVGIWDGSSPNASFATTTVDGPAL